MIMQKVVHRTRESRKQGNVDKAVMKWQVKQCKATSVQYKHKQHRAISAADTVAGLLKIKFSASDGWLLQFSKRHDITNRSKFGEVASAKETGPYRKKAAYSGGQGVVILCGFQCIITITCNNLNTVKL